MLKDELNSNTDTDLNSCSWRRIEDKWNRGVLGKKDVHEISCEDNGKEWKPLQCDCKFCWCAYADGKVIPRTKLAILGPRYNPATCKALRMGECLEILNDLLL